MSQVNSFAGRRKRLALGAFAALGIAGAASGCGFHHQPAREIVAHTRVVQGISHADPAIRAGHYCTYCHGAALGGGVHQEPSCYQCHGQTWLDVPGAASQAPADHTVVQAGFPHRPGSFQPSPNCTDCHGADLSGQTSSNTAIGRTIPGCELCHTKLWEERSPPPGGG